MIWASRARSPRTIVGRSEVATVMALEAKAPVERVDAGRGDLGEVDGCAVQAHGGGVGGDHRVEVADQGVEAQDFVVQRAELFGCCGLAEVLELFERAAQHGDRGAQLVAQVGDEVAAQALLVVKAVGHLVEGVRELDELARGARGAGAGAAVAGGQAGDGDPQLPQRARRACAKRGRRRSARVRARARSPAAPRGSARSPARAGLETRRRGSAARRSPRSRPQQRRLWRSVERPRRHRGQRVSPRGWPAGARPATLAA